MTPAIRRGISIADSLIGASPRDWPEIIEARRMFCRRALPDDCRQLLDFIEDGRAAGFGGFPDEETYIRDGLGLDPEAVRWAVEGLRVVGLKAPQSFASMEAVGRVVAAEVMARAEPLARNGERGPARKSVDNVKANPGGNSVDYLAARIKRDRPDIADAVERGEFKSIRAAAIAAGIVKQRTGYDRLVAAWNAASEEERRQFLTERAA